MAFWELDAMQLKQADGTLDAFESISGAYYDSDDDEVEYKRAQYSRVRDDLICGVSRRTLAIQYSD